MIESGPEDDKLSFKVPYRIVSTLTSSRQESGGEVSSPFLETVSCKSLYSVGEVRGVFFIIFQNKLYTLEVTNEKSTNIE